LPRPHRHSRRGLAYAVSFVLLAAAALFPEACVGFAETRLLAAAVWLVAAAALLFPARHRKKPLAVPRALVACLLLLGLWGVFQLVPLPASFAPFLWRGVPFPDRAELLAGLVSRAGGALSVAVDPHRSLHALVFWSGLACLAFAAAKRLRTTSARNAVLHGIVALAAAESVHALFARADGLPRLRGTFANSDALGGLIAISLALTAGGLFAALEKNGGRLRGAPRHVSAIALFLAAGVLQLVVLFFTGSRGATFAALAGLAPLFFLRWKESPRFRRALLFAVPAAAALFAVFWINAQRLNVLERATGEDALAEAAESRGGIWRAGARLVRDFPLGAGANGAAAVMPVYQDERHGRVRLDYAHNDTLQFLGDFGLPGFALLLASLVLLAARARRVCAATGSHLTPPWMVRGAAAGLVASLVHAQVEFNLSARPSIQLVFALLAGVLLSCPLSSAPGKEDDAPRERKGFRLAWLAKAALVPVAVFAVVSSLSAAAAYRIARAAALAAGLPTPPTDSAWCLPSPLPPAGAAEALAKAQRLDPFSPFVPEAAAEAALAAHRAAVTNAALATDAARRAMEGSEEEADESPETPSPAALAASELALRFDEAAVVRDARPLADEAARRAPWAPETAILRDGLVLRGRALAVASAEEADAAKRDLSHIARLWQNDALVQFAVASALASERNPANHPALSAAAARAVTLDPSLAADGFAVWSGSGMTLGEIVSLLPPTVPFDVLRRLYLRVGDAEGVEEERTALFDKLLAARPPAPDKEFLRRAGKAFPEKAAVRARKWAAEEALARALRAGDRESVAAGAAEREELRVLAYLADVQSLRASPMHFRLRLRDLARRNRLPREGRVEHALAECAAGRDPADFAAVWREAAAAPLPESLVSALPAEAKAPAGPAPAAEPTENDALAVSFLGERLFLDGFRCEKTADKPPEYRVACRWRAAAPPLPPRLALRIRLRDEAGRLVVQKHLSFDEASAEYRRGDIPPGTVFELSQVFPMRASLAETVELLLFDGGRGRNGGANTFEIALVLRVVKSDDLATAAVTLPFEPVEAIIP